MLIDLCNNLHIYITVLIHNISIFKNGHLFVFFPFRVLLQPVFLSLQRILTALVLESFAEKIFSLMLENLF